MSEEEVVAEAVHTLQQLSSQNDIDGVINLLNSITGPDGPIHPDNEKELNIWNIPGWAFFLRRGKYQEAEKIYRAFYNKLLEHQVSLGRLHKGMALQNLGLSFFYQGKTEEAIKFFTCAYIEDAIRGKGSIQIEQSPASRVLRGFCGVPQPDLFQIRDFTLEIMRKEVPMRPELIYGSPELGETISRIQQRYHKYIPETWKWEIEGQAALEKGEYEKSHSIYEMWFKRFSEYQRSIETRIHKGHPLFNAGISLFLQGKKEEALNLFLLAYVEDVVSAFNIGEADNTAAFKNLSSIIPVGSLREIETAIFQMKNEGKDVDNPTTIIKQLQDVEEKARKEFEEQREKILASKTEKDTDLISRISKKKEISDDIDNTLYIMKRWNSATPRYPPEEAFESFGGGYFIVWNKKGVVIDPGYDFLRFFYEAGFGVLNIDLIIVTHAHDDHCQDLEAIFSVLHKLNQADHPHSIDLVISEGVQIKYSRLLTIMREYVHNEILLPGNQLDPSTISQNQYNMELHATRTEHNEEPWMKNNTGFGLLVSLKKDTENIFKIGLTGDTAFWNGIENEFDDTSLLIEHIGTYGTSETHLCDVGCVKLLKRIERPPHLVVISEFGEELKGNRVNVCTLIESLANRTTMQGIRIPVIAGDVGLRIRIPSLKIFCSDTNQFEDFTDIVDKEIRENIEYLKRE